MVAQTSVFDEIIMEASISDTHGRNIWKKNFYSKDGIKEVVPDRDFLRALFLYFNRPLDGHRSADETAVTCLRTLLGTPACTCAPSALTGVRSKKF